MDPSTAGTQYYVYRKAHVISTIYTHDELASIYLAVRGVRFVVVAMVGHQSHVHVA